VRRRRELAFNRRTARAVAGAMVMLALIAVIGITVGYLTA
jgi:type IV secretory pathway component VirB8